MTTLTAVLTAPGLAPALHPLDPLTPQEMERAVEILRQSGCSAGASPGAASTAVSVVMSLPPVKDSLNRLAL